jgi:hypothetical protein
MYGLHLATEERERTYIRSLFPESDTYRYQLFNGLKQGKLAQDFLTYQHSLGGFPPYCKYQWVSDQVKESLLGELILRILG